MIAYFERFKLTMTKEQAMSASHPGDCTADVEDLYLVPAIRRQLDKIGPEDIRAELKEYGAWDNLELLNDLDNVYRILWIAAGDIREEVIG